MPDRLLFTCEHGGNQIPRRYAALFEGAADVLATHRGYDPGALALARRFAAACSAPLYYSRTSRLLVELNRSPRHPQLFSEFSRGLGAAERRQLLENYYRPYRDAVELQIRELMAGRAPVLHVSVHSFTPVLNGVTRTADVGLLYDPARSRERAAATRWLRALGQERADLRLRRNYPYFGVSDGFTTYLRRQFSDAQYAGIEIEVNQRWPLQGGTAWRNLQRSLIAALQYATDSGTLAE